MLPHLELPAAGADVSRILGQLERTGLGEQAVSLIISGKILIGAHWALYDITG